MLRYLDEVARAGSIRKAATRLNIASSAINRQILALEQEIGTPIFERVRKRLRLSAAGELLIGHVRQTLKEHERVRGRIEDLKGLRRGEVSIATMDGLASSVLAPNFGHFRQRHPGISLTARVLSVNDIAGTVAAGEVDLGFAFDLPADPGLQTFAKLESRLGAVVAPGHPLTELPSVSLSACFAYPLILPEAGFTLRRVLNEAFVRQAVKIEPVLETNSMSLIKRAVALDFGVAFFNSVEIAEERRRGEVVFLPLRDRQLKPQTLSIVHRAKGGGLETLPSLMAEELKAVLDALAREGR
jgi:DNA-binding transcriptional LysR family regulator